MNISIRNCLILWNNKLGCFLENECPCFPLFPFENVCAKINYNLLWLVITTDADELFLYGELQVMAFSMFETWFC